MSISELIQSFTSSCHPDSRIRCSLTFRGDEYYTYYLQEWLSVKVQNIQDQLFGESREGVLDLPLEANNLLISDNSDYAYAIKEVYRAFAAECDDISISFAASITIKQLNAILGLCRCCDEPTATICSTCDNDE